MYTIHLKVKCLNCENPIKAGMDEGGLVYYECPFCGERRLAPEKTLTVLLEE